MKDELESTEKETVESNYTPFLEKCSVSKYPSYKGHEYFCCMGRSAVLPKILQRRNDRMTEG